MIINFFIYTLINNKRKKQMHVINILSDKVQHDV